MIYFDTNGSTLKDIVNVQLNINNTIKSIKGIWYNDGGTLRKIWPDYAYNGTSFVGELTGGFVNIPTTIHYDSLDRAYTSFNDGSNITSGSFYVSSFNSYQQGSIMTPAVCTSVRNIDFSKYSSIRIKGTWSAWANTLNGYHSVQYHPTIRVSAATISGNTITEYGDADQFCGTEWSWSSPQYESGQGNSGTRNYDVTLDISSITKNSALLMIRVLPGAFESSYSLVTSNASFNIQRIELF